MAKNQNTVEKRRREADKKRKAEEKRRQRVLRKDAEANAAARPTSDSATDATSP